MNIIIIHILIFIYLIYKYHIKLKYIINNFEFHLILNSYFIYLYSKFSNSISNSNQAEESHV